jgi:orotate phosphoribosyltransferase
MSTSKNFSAAQSPKQTTDDLLNTLPVRRGHFLLESGCHTDLWFALDALFLSPQDIAPQVKDLAELLRPSQISAVCGPLLGGAFLAQSLAGQLGVRFYFTQPVAVGPTADDQLFAAEYRLPSDLRRHVATERVAVVDDCISAGSSVRATSTELAAAGATTVVVGTMLLLGDRAANHFSALNVPVVSLAHQGFNLWTPGECPLCGSGEPLEDPTG